MYKQKKIIGIITARGGSKGIPKKNIKELGGKPLIAYTIESAQKSKYLTSFLLSTDNNEIADVARLFGCDVPFIRPAHLAEDKSSSIPVIQHALTWLREERREIYDYVMILQPTSPFRTAEDIDACIEKIVETDADSVMSMVELTDFSLKKLKRIEHEDIIFPLLEEEGQQSSQRQEFESVYKRNCAIYLTRVNLIEKGDLFGAISRAYIMPFDRSIDINTPFDFSLAEFFVQQYNKI